MFDFIKMETKDIKLSEELLSNSLLTFCTQVNEGTGEIINAKQTADYGNMVFNIYPNGRIFIKGSLHKLYNFILGRAINHDTFTYQKVRYIISFLKDHFKINPETLSIHNLEFGVNIEPKIPVNRILNSFIVYKHYPFNNMKVKRPGYGKDCFLDEYTLKIYNKGAQYNCEENIMRFEKKIVKMRSEFKNKHLVLNDLLDKSIWFQCALSLFKALDNIIITDKLNQAIMTKPDLNTYNECENPRSWSDFTRSQRSQKKERFNLIIKSYSQLNLRLQLKNLMYGAVNRMLSYPTYHSSIIGTVLGSSLPNWNNNFLNEPEQNK